MCDSPAPIDHPVLQNKKNPYASPSYFSQGPSYDTQLTNKMYPNYTICPDRDACLSREIVSRQVPVERQEMHTDMRPGFHVCHTFVEPEQARYVANKNLPLLGKGNLTTYVENVSRERVMNNSRDTSMDKKQSSATIFQGPMFHPTVPSETQQCCMNISRPLSVITDPRIPSCTNRVIQYNSDQNRLSFNNHTKEVVKKYPYPYKK